MTGYSLILAKQQDGEEAILFEGNNPLPFFWLMLLDKADVDFYRAKITQISQQEAEHSDTSIAVDKLKAISLAAGRRDYIKQYYQSCIPIFDEWIYFMQTSDFSDMKIYIDLYQARLCYPSPDEFAESLLKAITCFDEQKEAWYEETIAGTCGHEGRHKNKKRFNEISKSYQKLNRKNIYGGFEKKLHLDRKVPAKKKLQLIGTCIILIIIIGILLFLIK